MKRKSINPPNDWGGQFQLDQAEVISKFKRIMHFSGQAAIETDPDAEMGVSVAHPGDQGAQMQFIFKNIDQLLAKAKMSRKNIINLRFLTVDMEGLMANYELYIKWISEAGIRPPQTAVAVKALVLPEMLVEVEVVAAK